MRKNEERDTSSISDPLSNATFGDWMETLGAHLGALTSCLIDINTSIAAHKIVKYKDGTDEVHIQESTLSGGATTTQPRESIDVVRALEEYKEFVIFKDNESKVYTARFIPNKGSTEGVWVAINNILKAHDFVWWKDESDAKNSHWRKK